MNDLTGHTLGQYTITERLGRGGMADVYKAFHPGLAVYRAIKVIRPEFVTTEDFRARFQNEAQAVAALRHPNIVQIHDFGFQDDTYYMVMEFVEGQDLKKLLQREGQIRPLSRAVEIVDQVASALHYAHSRGVVHRDIKPENVMLNQEGQAILMDFGIAKLLTVDAQLTRTGMGIGTPAYMAPEQAKASPEIGPPADIYSLSVVLYELVTGRVPYSADTPLAVMLKAVNDPMPLPRQFSPDISESLQQVILKGTAKQAPNRYQTAMALQEALQQALAEESAPVAQPDQTVLLQDTVEIKSPPDKDGKRGVGMAVLAVGLLALVGGIGAFFVLRDDPPPEPQTVAGEPAPTRASGPIAAPSPPQDTPVTAQQAPPPATAPVQAPVRASPVAADGSAIILEQRGATETAGQALRYEVAGKKDEVWFFDLREATKTTDFTLTAPDGRSRVFENYTDHGPFTLEQDGAYTLDVKTRNDKTSEFDFALWRLEPASIDGGAIVAGQYLKNKTGAPGQDVVYRFDGHAEQAVFFEVTETSQTTDFTLTAPDGRTVVFENYDDKGPISLPQDGAYTLRADPRGDKTAEFEFVLWHIDPPIIAGGTIELGKFVVGATRIPGQQARYELTGAAGQQWYFDLDKTSATTDFTLLAPDGRSQVFDSYGDIGPVTLEQDGTYTLLVDPRSAKTADYEFVIHSVADGPRDQNTVTFNKYVAGSTTVPGQAVSYTIDGRAGQTVYFQVTKTSATTDFALTAPDGRSEVFKSYSNKGPIGLQQDGAYTLVADPRGDKTAEFEFILWDVDPLLIDGGAIELNKYVNGATSTPGQTARYRFDAAAGQTLFFQVTRVSATTDFTVLAPDGRTQLIKHYDDKGPVPVKQDGTYTLTVDPRGDKTAEFEFVLWDVNPAVIDGGTIAVNEFVKGATKVAGQSARYTFNGRAGDTLFFDVTNTTSTTDFSLTAPDGRKQLFKHYTDKGPITLENDGAHVLLVDPRSAKTAEYEFIIKQAKP